MKRALQHLIVFLLVAAAPGAWAAVIHVPGDQPTIRAGIDAATDGDTVLVAPGTYTGIGNRDIHLSGKAITVESAGGAGLTIIDCGAAGSGFIIGEGEGADSIVRGFTITNGWEHGIQILDSSPTIEKCVLLRNSAAFEAAGLIVIGGSPAIENCAFYGNRLATMDPDDGSIGGGASVSFGGYARFRNCLFVGNGAARGSAVFTHTSGYADLIHCTVTANDVVLPAVYDFDSQIGVMNSIVHGNGNGEDQDIEAGPPVYSDITTYEGDPFLNNINEDPMFVRNPSPGTDGVWGTVDDDYGDLHLRPTSPCVDSGGISHPLYGAFPLPAVDFDGNQRVVGPAPDMGAYELQGPSVVGHVVRVRRSLNRYGVTVRLTNLGTAPATTVKVLAASLNGILPTPPLPSTVKGSIAPGGWVDVFVAFPLSAGSRGDTVVFNLNGSFLNGGKGYFTISDEVVLP